MPADLGGMIYLTIENRTSWKKTANEVAQAICAQIADDVPLNR